MITKEEINDLIGYLNPHNTIKEFKVKLEKEKWKIDYVELGRNYSIENIEKKTYKNSFDKEFDVYKIDKKTKEKLISVRYIIKLADKEYIGVIYNVIHDKYYLLKLNGYVVSGIGEKIDFDKETVIKTRKIVKRICEDNDLLFKKRLKNLVNKKEKNSCYEIINKQILKRTFDDF